MMILKAPEYRNIHYDEILMFLAGSIDMGAAENWQEQLEREFADYDGLVILNPRRDDWDSSWEQSISNPKFKEQVAWELYHLDRADMIVYYFDPKGQAPITLLELGLHASDDKPIIVCCPDGYWRKGNVEIVCENYGLTLTHTKEEFIQAIKTKFHEGW